VEGEWEGKATIQSIMGLWKTLRRTGEGRIALKGRNFRQPKKNVQSAGEGARQKYLVEKQRSVSRGNPSEGDVR